MKVMFRPNSTSLSRAYLDWFIEANLDPNEPFNVRGKNWEKAIWDRVFKGSQGKGSWHLLDTEMFVPEPPKTPLEEYL